MHTHINTLIIHVCTDHSKHQYASIHWINKFMASSAQIDLLCTTRVPKSHRGYVCSSWRIRYGNWNVSNQKTNPCSYHHQTYIRR